MGWNIDYMPITGRYRNRLALRKRLLVVTFFERVDPEALTWDVRVLLDVSSVGQQACLLANRNSGWVIRNDELSEVGGQVLAHPFRECLSVRGNRCVRRQLRPPNVPLTKHLITRLSRTSLETATKTHPRI